MHTYLEQIAAMFLVTDTLLFTAGVTLILSGMFLRWRLSYLWMQAEERAKDGWLSEDQARRRIALMRFSGPVMILLGIVALGLLFVG